MDRQHNVNPAFPSELSPDHAVGRLMIWFPRAFPAHLTVNPRFFARLHCQSTNQSSNQPANQPTNQPTNQPINQSINQSTNQPTNQASNQSINQSSSLRLGVFVPHCFCTCLPVVSRLSLVSHLFPTCLPHLSPTLGARMILHLSPTCVPVCSGCSGPQCFCTCLWLVWHLSPTCPKLVSQYQYSNVPCCITKGELQELQEPPT